MLPLVLASGSPRRRDLLRAVGLDFAVQVPDVDETVVPGEAPEQMVERLAAEKADAVARTLGKRETLVIGADTTVVLDGAILGKPVDPEEARAMLGSLSGRTHTVYTGFAVVDASTGESVVAHERTDVTFRELELWEIDEYVAGGSPMDKAGAYGIQEDRGALFVERIAGDYYTVVGLPLCQLWLAIRNVMAARGSVS